MNRRIFVIQVFSGLVYQTVQTFLVTGIRRREDGKKKVTNDGGSYGFGRGSSDDGEPSGTAGKPILEVITRMGVHNCLIIVTRYFGGTLLGTGGLVRAYTDASVAALNNSRLATQVQGVRYVITTDYNGAGKIQYGMASLDAIIDDTEYTDKVTIKVVIEKEREKLLIDTVTEITNGRAVILKDCELPVEKNISL